jgi:hypothetical protein
MRSEILSIVAVIGLMPCAGRAQEAGGGVACPSIENDQERLACYDRSLRGGPRAPSSTATPVPSAQPPAAVAAPVAVGAAAAASPPPAVTVAPPPVTTAPAQATVVPQAAPTAAPTAPASNAAAPTNTGAVAAAATTAAVAATAASQATTAGAGAAAATPSSTISTAPHNSRNKHAGSPGAPGAPPTIDPATGQPTGIMPVVVLSTLVRPGFPTEFTTDKGGVWVQGETKPLPTLPKAPFNAQLEPGTFGGAFLVVPDRKLGVRVHSADR